MRNISIFLTLLLLSGGLVFARRGGQAVRKLGKRTKKCYKEESEAKQERDKVIQGGNSAGANDTVSRKRGRIYRPGKSGEGI
jgi:hypothetical protein